MHDRDAKSFNDKFDKDSDVIKAYNTEMIQIEEKEDALEAKEENCKIATLGFPLGFSWI